MGATVVVANPDEAAREVIARVVETGGFDAVRLEPGSDPVDAVLASRADAVVLDLGADNLDIIIGLRQRTEAAAAAARVVVLGAGPATGRRALQSGADAYLQRPFHADELRAALTDALARPEPERSAWRTIAIANLGN